MAPKYEQIENALTGAQSAYAPEDYHGMLCAMLVVNNSLGRKCWLDEICTRTQMNQLKASADFDTLCSLYDRTRYELNDTLLNFSLLIPEDSNLNERVVALKKWCEGFLFGLALAGVKNMPAFPEDSFEVLQDIVLIS